MGKLSNNTQHTLPEFQKFLRERKLVPAKNVPFFAYWASKFLTFFNNNENLNYDLRIKKFGSFVKKLKSGVPPSDWTQN